MSSTASSSCNHASDTCSDSTLTARRAGSNRDSGRPTTFGQRTFRPRRHLTPLRVENAAPASVARTSARARTHTHAVPTAPCPWGCAAVAREDQIHLLQCPAARDAAAEALGMAQPRGARAVLGLTSGRPLRPNGPQRNLLFLPGLCHAFHKRECEQPNTRDADSASIAGTRFASSRRSDEMPPLRREPEIEVSAARDR